MGESAFKELFGEYEKKRTKEIVVDTRVEPESSKGKKEISEPNKKFKLLLACFLSVIVVCLMVIIFFVFKKDVSQENNNLEMTPASNEIVIENVLDSFMAKFLSRDYKVDDFGAFAYIYDDVEDGQEVKKNGVISLGENPTYFKNGKIAAFDFNENLEVLWDEYSRKHILLKESKQFFFVRDSSDYYYRYYVGQHILQDLVDDYLRNKEFIVQLSENTWVWEWLFYTPADYATKYSMDAEISIDLEREYITQIKLLNDGREMCVYEFSFEEIVDFDPSEKLQGYEQIDEEDLNL